MNASQFICPVGKACCEFVRQGFSLMGTAASKLESQAVAVDLEPTVTGEI